MTAWIIAHWSEIGLGVMVIDRVVAVTSTKYDDAIWGKIKSVISVVKPNDKISGRV